MGKLQKQIRQERIFIILEYMALYELLNEAPDNYLLVYSSAPPLSNQRFRLALRPYLRTEIPALR